jgi:hypothetical protein
MVVCLVLTAGLTAALARWPNHALSFLPAILACCAVAASFAFDEPSPAVAAVTPRGAGWRRTTRLAAVLAPLALWTTVVAMRPGDLALQRPGWWLLGGSVVVLVAGLAGLAARREVPAPSGPLSAGVALGVYLPLVLATFLGWTLPYPIIGFPAGVALFWSALAALGLLAIGAAVRPGLRP